MSHGHQPWGLEHRAWKDYWLEHFLAGPTALADRNVRCPYPSVGHAYEVDVENEVAVSIHHKRAACVGAFEEDGGRSRGEDVLHGLNHRF